MSFRLNAGSSFSKTHYRLNRDAQFGEFNNYRIKRQYTGTAVKAEIRMRPFQTHINLFTFKAYFARTYRSFSCVMGKISGTIFLLNEERIRCIGWISRSYSDTPVELCHIRPQVNYSSALIHIDTCSHKRIRIPEQLLVGTVKNIFPKGTLRFGICLPGSVVICKFRHGHIDQLTLLLKTCVICHSVLIRLFKKLIRRLPAAHLVEPSRAYEHHVVCITAVILGKMTVLIHEVVKIRILPCFGIVNHSAQDILRVRAEI